MNISKVIILLLRLICCISLIYTAIILIFSGLKTSFLWFWPVLSVVSLGYSAILQFTQNVPKYHIIHSLLIGFVVFASLCFISVEIALVSYARHNEPESANYMIILGAQVRGEIPSLSLQARIDTAADYLKKHPSTIAICSGGKGSGENISEAEAIRRGLLSHGVSDNQILLESRSTSTKENFMFSKDFIRSVDSTILIVTNNFHCLRASILAKRTGFTDTQCLPAGKFLATTMHYYVREFFAIVKTLLSD